MHRSVGASGGASVEKVNTNKSYSIQDDPETTGALDDGSALIDSSVAHESMDTRIAEAGAAGAP